LKISHLGIPDIQMVNLPRHPDYYGRASEKAVAWISDIATDQPIGRENLVVSAKVANLPRFAELPAFFSI
jgi:hypothetical protein